MIKQFKLVKGDSQERQPNEPVLHITGTGKNTYLWVGNDAKEDGFCFATLSGKATLEKLANSILEALGDKF
jgi:hypothetical protein